MTRPGSGKRLAELNLRERFEAAIIGLRLDDGNYKVAPNGDYCLSEGESLIAVAPIQHIAALQAASRGGAAVRPRSATWQRIPSLNSHAIPSCLYT